MSTLNVMIGEILVDGKVSKRTMIEIEGDNKLILQASFKASEMDAKAKDKHILNYQEGLYDYGDVENAIPKGHSALDTLRMKNVALTRKKKEKLIGSLTLDEKRFYGTWLNENEHNSYIVEEIGGELDGQLSFGNKTYEGGVEIHTNNKY